MRRSLRTSCLAGLLAFGVSVTPFWLAQPAYAGLFDWETEVYIIDTRIVGHDPATGAYRLANGMQLDQRVERFILVEPVRVGDRVRLIFDDTRFLRRVRVLH